MRMTLEVCCRYQVEGGRTLFEIEIGRSCLLVQTTVMRQALSIVAVTKLKQ